MWRCSRTAREKTKRRYGRRYATPRTAPAIYSDGIGIVIADHNNQTFQLLSEVQPGDRAYILRGESITTLECGITFDGRNDGDGVTDADGVPATYYAEYICYTCGTDWTNVKIVGFNVIDEDLF